MKQNSTAKNIAQMIALTIILSIAIITISVMPAYDNPAWLTTLFGSKALGVAGLYLTFRLETMWRPGNKWLQTYYRWCKEAEETPNPMYIGKEEEEE